MDYYSVICINAISGNSKKLNIMIKKITVDTQTSQGFVFFSEDGDFQMVEPSRSATKAEIEACLEKGQEEEWWDGIGVESGIDIVYIETT